MAQTTVTRFYNTRKRDKRYEDLKLVKGLSGESNLEKKSEKLFQNTKTVNQTIKNEKNAAEAATTEEISSKKKKNAQTKKRPIKGDNKTKTKQMTMTNFYQSQSPGDICKKVETLPSETSKSLDLKPKRKANPKKNVAKNTTSDLTTKLTENSHPIKKLNATAVSVSQSNINNQETVIDRNQAVFQSPKRKLPTPDVGSPSKKRLTISTSDENTEQEDRILSLNVTPSKLKSSQIQRNLLDSLESGSKVVSPNGKSPYSSPQKLTGSEKLVHSPYSSPRKLTDSEKLDALINRSRSKLILSPKLDELKKSLAEFSRKASKIKEFQANPFKITSSVRSSQSIERTNLPENLQRANERFKHLTEPDSTSLVLPVKYKLLSEMFRSMDTVVSILNNRKEKATFEKVQKGIQEMMKRNFSKTHFGQIVTIYPSAYSVKLERSTRKIDGLEYQLIITPNLLEDEGNTKKSKSRSAPCMQPQCLISREKEFHSNLLKLVKKHHEDFLKKLNFPIVSASSIKRWHPKFPVDSVPDIQAAELPEPPESRIWTAKDVLNKVKGSLKNKKIERALQSVAEESSGSPVTIEVQKTSSSKPESSKSALKGICTDLLEKIRARESAKLLETMTRDPEETERLAMLERLPKIINILWHYFIAERKAAVPVDTAVEKIIHSMSSLSTPDYVKEHLKLISETFPGWLTFVRISKGVYITIDRKRNINEMMKDFKH